MKCFAPIFGVNEANLRIKDEAQHKKCFSFRIYSANVTKYAGADLVTFAEEILNAKHHFLCGVI